ncbi:MAG: phage tail protein [Saprospiraceae bacterium]|nr:phage tail protein [Saprospiraceae bacterium]
MAYPQVAFQFRVDIADMTAEFSEVTGLNIEVQPIEYRNGLTPDYSTIKMPGMQKFGNVTLKRGVFKGNNEFFDWYKTIKMNTVTRKTVKISLLDETGAPVMEWELRNAFPTKITAPDMKASGNEVAIESMELVHEGMNIVNG